MNLTDLQEYVRAMEQRRGFAHKPAADQARRLVKEAMEVLEAIVSGGRVAGTEGDIVGSVDEELADVLLFTAAIANRYDIDLTTAVRRKEEHNEGRTWPEARTHICFQWEAGDGLACSEFYEPGTVDTLAQAEKIATDIVGPGVGVTLTAVVRPDGRDLVAEWEQQHADVL